MLFKKSKKQYALFCLGQKKEEINPLCVLKNIGNIIAGFVTKFIQSFFIAI
jgi:hypothetical protein